MSKPASITITLEQVAAFDASDVELIFFRPPQGPFRMVFFVLERAHAQPVDVVAVERTRELLIEVDDIDEPELLAKVKAALLPTAGNIGWVE